MMRMLWGPQVFETQAQGKIVKTSGQKYCRRPTEQAAVEHDVSFLLPCSPTYSIWGKYRLWFENAAI